MRISDLLWMALKNLKARFMVLPVAAIAISTFCLCFAGAVLTSVQQEKGVPCELEVLPGAEQLSESTLAGIAAIPDVTAVTPVLQVPVSLQTGGYTAQLTLTGMDASYLTEDFAQGGIYSDSSVMPYIVLNKAACKLFTDEKSSGNGTTDEEEEPPVDWLNSGVSIQTGENTRPVVAKLVGILSADDEDQEPAAYISIASAKALLQQDSLSADYFEANVRITNAGYAESVTKAVTGLGLSVTDSNAATQDKWDTELLEMTYLILLSVFGLVCWALLAATGRKILLLEHEGTILALQWIGMKKQSVGQLFLLQSLMSVLLGSSIGIIVGVAVPSFLPPELFGMSIFSLQIPFEAASVSAAICIAFGFLFVRLKNLKGI